MRTFALLLCLTSLFGCASASTPTVVPVPEAGGQRISAFAFARDRSSLWYATGDVHCQVRVRSLSGEKDRIAFELDWCPNRITPVDDESMVLTDGSRRGAWRRQDGTEVVVGDVLAATSVTDYVLARSGRVVWIRDSQERDIGAAGVVRMPMLVPASGDLLSIVRVTGGERIIRATREATLEASAVFRAIDSFDVAPRGDEFVLSAAREGGFDVAIASVDGKTVNWIPSDRADEVGVTWAPRGNKVSYLIRRADSTIVRTVHVPTSFQLMFETPFETVRGLAWEPRAERVAMILDGPATSPHVDWIEYAGANRESLVAPHTKLRREPERLTLVSESAVFLPPATVRYGEKLPLFVTLSDDPLGWDASLRDLDSLVGGILRLRSAEWNDGTAISSMLAEMPWIGADDVVIMPFSRGDAGFMSASKGQTLIQRGTKPTPGRFFTESTLSGGGMLIEAETWEGAMTYLRGRFQSKR